MARVAGLRFGVVASGLALGCAYPHLQMGEGATGGASAQTGGSSARSGKFGGTGGRDPSGGSSTALSTSGAATSASSSVSEGGTSASSTTATSTLPSGNCLLTTNLLDDLGDESGQWIGGLARDPSDDPCGVQGSVYAFSDVGIDAIACTGDESIRQPACASNSDADYNPCNGSKCCIRGRTSAAPADEPDAPVWGAGMGLFLAMDESGNSSPYAGPARGFVFQISGRLSGQTLSLEYAFGEGSDPISMSVPAFGEVRLPFLAPGCEREPCSAPVPRPRTIQFFVGGGVDGDFELCIERITPIL